MKEGNVICPPVRSSARYDDQCVRRAVYYIISEKNVHHISWGTKRIIIGNKEVIFPRLIRRQIIQQILMGYIDLYPHDQRIGNTSFKIVAKSITCHNQKAKNAVDYVSGILIYDNFILIRRICATADASDKLLKVLNALEAFLEGPYNDHAGKYCVTESVLCLTLSSSESYRSCAVCSFPARVIVMMKDGVDEIHHNLLTDCMKNMTLYCGHRIRTLIQ
jgi:hypothetical protein